ncbi:hypothetical protein CCACVL1_21716 [Corchorus capsularis]|uniref:Uncharacterized protein n=1 Tax=Corchorus capsularis TaxID=210143 RepID=A0A1R3H2M1_COCAP|nr:hypothetical protein CCACVL1_21716 [Corchorus capsularis]
MEEPEKINGRKKLPSIPANYISLAQLQERWIKERKQKEKEENKEPEPELGEKEEKKEPEPELGEKEDQVEERVNDKVDGRGSRKSGQFRRRDRENWKRVADRNPSEEEKAADSAVKESDGVEKEKNGDKLKNKKSKWKKWKKKNKEEKARAENGGEEVIGTAANAPLPASVECDKEKEEVIADEVHAPKQAGAEEEDVEARTEDRTMEIGRKFGGMSMKGEYRIVDHRRYGRQNGGFNHRGGNWDLNGSHHEKFGRRRELNQRNEGMVWVKKGEGSDGNVGGISRNSVDGN